MGRTERRADPYGIRQQPVQVPVKDAVAVVIQAVLEVLVDQPILVIVDGPPGIGCPVIASITGTDLVLAVTEPTLSGLHDLERVRQLADHFKTRTVACVNKFDLNPEMTALIEEHCRKNEVQIVGRIPYDRAVTDAQVQGTAVVEFSNGVVSMEIRKMWKHVAKILGLDDGPEG